MNKRTIIALCALFLCLLSHAQSAPRIISIDDETVIDNGYATLYDYSFTVTYEGAASVTVGVEEEFGFTYATYHINEASPAHVLLKYLSRGNKVWVDVTVENEYGKDTRTIEIPLQIPSAIGDVEDADVDHIDVYALTGKLLKRVKRLSELSGLRSQPVLLRYIDSDGKQLKVRKMLLR